MLNDNNKNFLPTEWEKKPFILNIREKVAASAKPKHYCGARGGCGLYKR